MGLGRWVDRIAQIGIVSWGLGQLATATEQLEWMQLLSVSASRDLFFGDIP